MKTRKGLGLARRLDKISGDFLEAVEACSLIHRHAVTYNRLQEMRCNGHPCHSDPRISVQRCNELQERLDKWIDRRERQIEKRIAELAGDLGLGVRFDGDPRGPTVSLLVSADRWIGVY